MIGICQSLNISSVPRMRYIEKLDDRELMVVKWRQLAVSSLTRLPTSLTISEPYHVLTNAVTGRKLILKTGGDVLSF